MAASQQKMDVPRFSTFVARSISKHPALWTRLGKLESGVLAPDLLDYPVKAPIYVNGLARSGTTMILEFLAAHAHTASHRYQDFPFIFTPYWWHAVLKMTPFKDDTKRERAHGDGMLVNAKSPEAMEEMLWMAFFPQCHNPQHSNVLGRETEHAAFADFYHKHIQKLLLAGKAPRYVSKGNYNITRMGFLQSIFNDARFIIPVRHPRTHIASLARQHAHFSEANKGNADVAKHMALAGHFEFGAARTPIHCGDDARMQEIQRAWANGEEILGWALYWDMIYRFVHVQLNRDTALKSAAKIVRYEQMCAQPAQEFREILAHCQLQDDAQLVATFSEGIKPAGEYESRFSADEQAIIQRVTQETAALYGYRD